MKTRTQKFRKKIKDCISGICFNIRLVWPEVLYGPIAYTIGYFGSYILLKNDSIKNFVSNLLNTTDIVYMSRFFGWISVGMLVLFILLLWIISAIEMRFFSEKKEH